MPLLELTAPAGEIPSDRLPALVGELVTITLRHRGMPDTATSRANTWTYVREPEERHVFVGAETSLLPLRLELTVPAGSMDRGSVAAFVAEATEAIVSAAGADPSSARDRASVWVLVRECPDGHWGAGGQPLSLAAIRSLVGG